MKMFIHLEGIRAMIKDWRELYGWCDVCIARSWAAFGIPANAPRKQEMKKNENEKKKKNL